MILALEGLPGSGKTTMAEYVHDRFNFKVVAELLGTIPDNVPEDAYIANDVRKFKLATSSTHAVMDRSYLSTLAYNFAYDKCHSTNAFGDVATTIYGLKEAGKLQDPDLYILLNIPTRLSLQRQKPGNASFWRDERMLTYTKLFNESFMQQLDVDKKRIIDASQPVSVVQHELTTIVDDYLKTHANH